MNIATVKKALNVYLKTLEDKHDLESLHETDKINRLLVELDKIVSPLELMKTGGDWLGYAREWIQCKFKNGERVNWSSGDILEGGNICVYDVEELASRIAASAINEHMKK